MLYPYRSDEILKELKSRGITRVYSFGQTQLPNGVRVLGKGKTGVVVLTEDMRALKVRRPDSNKESLEIEAKIQSMAEGVAPKVYDYGKNFILMEYVPGRPLSREDVWALKRLVLKARQLELKSVEHGELSRPWKNVLVRSDGELYVLDFDDATVKPNPKNVTSVLSAFGLWEIARVYARTKDLSLVMRKLDELTETLH